MHVPGYLPEPEATHRDPSLVPSGGFWVRPPAECQPTGLIVAHPGSGTLTFIEWLASMDCFVAHENIAEERELFVEWLVSWRYMRMLDRFRWVQYMVRRPLHTIWSAAGVYVRRPDLMQIVSQDLGGIRISHPLLTAARTWLALDELASSSCDRWFRREDVDTSSLPPLNRGWGVHTKGGINSHRWSSPRSWETLEAFDPKLVQVLRDREVFYYGTSLDS